MEKRGVLKGVCGCQGRRNQQGGKVSEMEEMVACTRVCKNKGD